MAKGNSFVVLTIYKILRDKFLMRDPKIVLKQLSSLKENQTVNGLYCNLYNPEFYKIAYNNISSKSSNMTPVADGSTVDGMSEERINKLIQSLKDKSYKPTPLRVITVPKKNGEIRRVGVPKFEDKLVQEIIRMILEALWEPHFSDCSHAYRPNRSCHTALKYVQHKFRATKWWITCDISGCFDNIKHVILLNLLKTRIREQKFIHLINLFLKSGYISNWKYDKTYSGVPQGTIIGLILSNIYLDKFDKYMEKMCSDFWKGEKRKRNSEYHRLELLVSETKRRMKNGKNIKENQERYIKRKKELRKYTQKNGQYDYYDPNFRRLSYVRYADDFLIGVVASKKETEEIKNKIINFLKNEVNLELNKEKTKIIHNSELIRFLSYDVSVMISNCKKTINGGVALWLPYEVCKNFILDNRFGKFIQDSKTGKHKFKALHRSEMINLDEYEILMQYNAKIRGLYNYYKLASNVCKLNGFNFILQTSFLKTLSAKYKTSCAKLYANKNYNHRRNGAHLGITKDDKFYEFFNGPFNVVKTVKYDKNIDIIENINKYFTRTSLIDRMNAKKCEFCGDTTGPFEIHHIHKLKDTKGKAPWQKLMSARNRKTLVLCVSCHNKLHAGKL